MPSSVVLARNAMATRFEIVLHGENENRLRAAGEEALDELERLEAQLSLYRPESELSHINRRAAFEAVRVEPQLFRLLQRAQTISQQTNGAFDITAGPLIRCWGFMADSGAVPDQTEIDAARAIIGFELLELNASDLTVRFQKQGVMLDLGSIGKGYALDRAAEILREAGIENALLHGGTSTTVVLGSGHNGEPWRIAIEAPPQTVQALIARQEGRSDQRDGEPLAIVELQNEALSVSAVWGKAFVADGRMLGHIIDPRTGRPALGPVSTAVTTSSATDSDALSTALLVAPSIGTEINRGLIRSYLVCNYENGQLRIAAKGIEIRNRFGSNREQTKILD